MSEYSDKIRYIRKDVLKMSRMEFAQLLGSSEGFCAKIENGGSKLSKPREELLIQKANLPLDFFFVSKEASESVSSHKSSRESVFRMLFPQTTGSKVTLDKVERMINIMLED